MAPFIFSRADMKLEFRSPHFWRDLLAEFVGTFFLVSVQCMVPLNMIDPDAGARDGLVIALAMGFIVLVLIEVFGPMGGAHFNPAVTIGFLVANKITLLRGAIYILVQVSGALAGCALIYGVTPDDRRATLAGTSVNPAVTWWQAIMVEAWLTAILMFAILGSTNGSKRKVFMPAVPIGLAVALDILTGIEYTGSSMNPARSLAPAVFAGRSNPILWDQQYVYWVGPIIGSVLASAIYTLLDRIGQNVDVESKKVHLDE